MAQAWIDKVKIGIQPGMANRIGLRKLRRRVGYYGGGTDLADGENVVVAAAGSPVNAGLQFGRVGRAGGS